MTLGELHVNPSLELLDYLKGKQEAFDIFVCVYSLVFLGVLLLFFKRRLFPLG